MRLLTIYQQILKEEEEEEVSKHEVDKLESELDLLFKDLKMDVEFTPHFNERMNDPRNLSPITIEELKSLFYDIHDRYGNQLKKMDTNTQGVMKDPPTNINIPFVIDQHGDRIVTLYNKTIMKKKGFKPASTDKVLFAHPKNQPQDNTPREQEPIIKIDGVKWVVDGDNNQLIKKNNRNIKISLDDVMSKVDDITQEKIMELL